MARVLTQYPTFTSPFNQFKHEQMLKQHKYNFRTVRQITKGYHHTSQLIISI